MFAASSVSLSGCSSMWSGVGNFADMMSEKTQFLSLRGLSKKKEEPVLVAENTSDTVESELLATDAGVYLPEEEPVVSEPFDAEETQIQVIQGETAPCPEGTVRTDDVCLLLD